MFTPDMFTVLMLFVEQWELHQGASKNFQLNNFYKIITALMAKWLVLPKIITIVLINVVCGT